MAQINEIFLKLLLLFLFGLNFKCRISFSKIDARAVEGDEGTSLLDQKGGSLQDINRASGYPWT